MPLPPLGQLGPALRMLRRRSGLQQRQLADRAGFTRPQLSGYERGHHFPSLPSLWRHLDALGATLADLERAMHQRADLDREPRG